MTADGIVDAIDNALHDWATSQDAMRWQPPTEPTRPPAELTDLLCRVQGAEPFLVAPPGTEPASALWQLVGYVNATELADVTWVQIDPGVGSD